VCNRSKALSGENWEAVAGGFPKPFVMLRLFGMGGDAAGRLACFARPVLHGWKLSCWRRPVVCRMAQLRAEKATIRYKT
jgi:hypothetical protein